MDQPALPMLEGPENRRGGGVAAPARLGSKGGRLGRPPGGSKRALDLGRYIEATFGGMTPGQQSAELSMVKPADLAKARKLAAELGLVDLGLSPLMLAMAVKAAQLAKVLGCEKRDAWLMLQKERGDLMGYIHQKQAPAADKGGKVPIATVFMIPEGDANPAQLADFSANEDELDFIDLSASAPDQVGQPKSDDAP